MNDIILRRAAWVPLLQFLELLLPVDKGRPRLPFDGVKPRLAGEPPAALVTRCCKENAKVPLRVIYSTPGRLHRNGNNVGQLKGPSIFTSIDIKECPASNGV